MPAPVKGTMVDASAIMSPSCSTPLRRSDAIICVVREAAPCQLYHAARQSERYFDSDKTFGKECRPTGGMENYLNWTVALVVALARRRSDRRPRSSPGRDQYCFANA